ncbi:zinc finger MYM-type protein 1-like isoform X2 [Acyrthosiphon pisum]|uniref:TTF-type domain-containing protein n=1 Tax=Acyrthosiphon pisum TaxID=7029 RepID=A0A8R2H9Y1_ACYPI|nr:zinc finger MYM-type protein 1-like isoform X2 [Acyrthosiphon pisum]|eukprot:XP_016662686.1 PREDICTED: zinc finger MYM-type protein 1-like isoform X2 [Acyrthosiphon pisum]
MDSTKLNICHCGKNMRSLNSHNYRLHIKSCKQHKLSETSVKISTFFKVKTVEYTPNVIDDIILDEHGCSSMDQNIKTATDVEALTLEPSSSSFDTPNVIDDIILDEHGCSSMDQNIETSNETLSLISFGSSSDNRLTNDPGIIVKMKNVGPEMKKLIINIGPCQPTKDDFPAKTFPIDKNGRSFKDLWYFRLLTDGTKVLRDWLTYSVSLDKVYCLHCFLFGINLHDKLAKSWTQTGFSTWKNGIFAIQNHECAPDHILSSLKFKLRETNAPILPALEHTRKFQVTYNRQVILELIEIVHFLALHNLAFRGHREQWTNTIRGNFKDLVILMAKNSTVLFEHISKIKNVGKHQISFLSWQRQNQLLEAIAENISTKIIYEVQTTRIFSISIDSTFDESKREQVSFVIRYIDEANGAVKERLLARKESPYTTGKVLFDLFKDVMETNNLNWNNNLIGQSYDGASNMRGNYKGLQARISNDCSHALFIWCHAHRLNLVVKQAVSCNNDAVDMFGSLETLYALVWTSKKRVAIFRNNQSKRNYGTQLQAIKRVSTTRWMSHAAALDTVLSFFETIIDTLINIRDLEGPSDSKTGSTASGLILYFLSYKFLITAFRFKELFDILGPINKILQTQDFDVITATTIISQTKPRIQNMREDSAFEKINIKVDNFISDLEYEIEPLKNKRLKRVPKKSGELSIDEPIVEPIKKFRIETYNTLFDVTLTEINSRFNVISCGVLNDLSLLTEKRIMEVRESNVLPDDSFLVFCQVYNKFVDRNALISEYLQFVVNYKEIESTIKLKSNLHTIINDDDLDEDGNSGDENYIDFSLYDEVEDQTSNCSKQNLARVGKLFKLFCTASLQNVFPNLYLTLKITVTLPVSSCTVERSFSKLKLIKTKLRTTMCQDRLEQMVKISCEPDISLDK